MSEIDEILTLDSNQVEPIPPPIPQPTTTTTTQEVVDPDMELLDSIKAEESDPDMMLLNSIAAEDNVSIPSLIDDESDEFYEDFNPLPTASIHDPEYAAILGDEEIAPEEPIKFDPSNNPLVIAGELTNQFLLQSIQFLGVGPYATAKGALAGISDTPIAGLKPVGKFDTQKALEAFSQAFKDHMFPYGMESEGAKRAKQNWLYPLLQWYDEKAEGAGTFLYELLTDPKRKQIDPNTGFAKLNPILVKGINTYLERAEGVSTDPDTIQGQWAILMGATTESLIKGAPLALPLRTAKTMERRLFTPEEMEQRQAVRLLEEGKLIVGADYRHFDQAVNDWLIKGIDEQTGRQQWVPLAKDLPDSAMGKLVTMLETTFLPPKAMAMLHNSGPIQWAASQMSRINWQTNRLREALLNGNRIVFTKGRPMQVPFKSERQGFMEHMKGMTVEERAELARMHRQIRDEGFTRDLTPAELKTFGMNDKQIAAYTQIQYMFEKLRTVHNGVQAKYNGKNALILEREYNFYPATWDQEKPFRVFVKSRRQVTDPKNPFPDPITGRRTTISQVQVHEVLAFKTKAEARKALKEMEAEYGPGYNIHIGETKPGAYRDATQGFIDAHALLQRKGDPASLVAAAALEEAQASRGFKAHAKYKQDARGYQGDPKRIKDDKQLADDYLAGVLSYVEGATRAIQANKINGTLSPFLNRMGNHYPNTARYVGMYKEKVLGRQSGVDIAIDTYLNQQFVNSVGKGADKLSGFTLYTKLLLWKPSFIVSQIVQPYQMVTPYLAKLQGMGFKASVWGSVQEAMTQAVRPNAEFLKVAEEAAHRGVITPAFIDQFRRAEIEHTLKDFGKRDFATGMKLAKWAEEFSRTQAVFMIYSHLRRSGVPANTAKHIAIDVAPYRMVEYTLAEKPFIFSTDATRHMGQFKTFQMNYMAQFLEYAKGATAAERKQLKPLAVFMGNQLTVSGAKGLMGLAAADQMVHGLNFLFGEFFDERLKTPTEIIYETMPSWVVHGPMADATGIVNPTLNAPQLQVRDIISWPQLEQAAEIVSSVSSWVANSHRIGMTSPQEMIQMKADVGRVLKSVAPPHAHGLIEDLLQSTDEGVIISPQKGYSAMYKRNAREQLARHFGGRGVKEEQALDMLYVLNRALADDRNHMQSLANTLAWAAANKISFDPAQVEKYVTKYGVTSSEFNRMMENAIKRQNIEMIDRITLLKKHAIRKESDLVTQILELTDRLPRQENLNAGQETP